MHKDTFAKKDSFAQRHFWTKGCFSTRADFCTKRDTFAQSHFWLRVKKILNKITEKNK